MAMRNASCSYQRSLRSQSIERPQPLKRGQGVGGGNYRRVQSTVGAGGATSRNSAVAQARPSSCRSMSASSTSSRPCSPSSAPSTSCAQASSFKPRRTQPRSQRASVTSTPGSSRANVCEPGSSNMGMFQAGPSTKCKTPTRVCPEDKRRSSVNGQSPRSRLSVCDPESTSKGVTGPFAKRGSTRCPSSRSSSVTRNPAVRNRQSPAASSSRPHSMMAVSSPKPGPSCLRPPPAGAKRRVQFSGLSSPGPGPSPDSRSRYKTMPVPKRRCQREQLADSVCESDAGPSSTGSPQGQAYGPSLYPIYPDQYETPYVSLPGPRQVLLMPGDIDPNETTIIDIVGLNEGDMEEVPGIPPPAPSSLLDDAWNECVKEATEQDLKRRKSSDRKGGNKSSCGSPRNKRSKKEDQNCCLPNLSNLNYIHQGRAFSFEEYGNVRVDDPNNPPYEGPSFRAPDPECQRARPFTYKSRKTAVRSYTDEEKREIEEAGMYRAIRAIISEHDAKWERDRSARGLTDDDLINIDADDCAPSGVVQMAPRDIFTTTDQCGFGESYLPRSTEVSPMGKRPQSNQGEDLIAWDECATMPPTGRCNEADLLTQTPPRSPKRRQSNTSPNLMSMCEPEEDLLGLNTPPKPRSPSPSPMCNRDDLIRWESPRGSTPFDATCDENLFDNLTRTSPTAARLKTPPLSLQRGASSDNGCQGISSGCRPKDFSACSQREPRVVRAIPMECDPNTAVLENSPLASRTQPAMQEMDEDDSLGILEYDDPCGEYMEPWQRMDNMEEDFHNPLPSPNRSRYNSDISGVAPLDECEDDDDLGILDENCLPDFEFSSDADARLREEAKYQTMFQPLCEGAQYLDREECPFESEFEDLGRQFEEERADLLNLCHEPEVGPIQKREYGRFGSELVEQCPDPIEQCQDLLGLLEPSCNGTPPKRMGPFGRELIESCPDEQQLIDLDDECQTEQPPCPPRFNYSRDLFTNVQWDPSMAPNSKKMNDNQCPQ